MRTKIFSNPGMAANGGQAVTFGWRRQNIELASFSTPGGADNLVTVTINDEVRQALRAVISDFLALGRYDDMPDCYEEAAFALLKRVSPPLCKALEEAGRQAPAAIAVAGLQLTDHQIPTPANGIVDVKTSGVQAGLLVGVAKAMGLSGFAYATENEGLLLRGVCAVKKHQRSASSQGAADLAYHQDNVTFIILGSDDTHSYPHPPMNAVQGFAAITTFADIPMRMVALKDVLAAMSDRGWDDHAKALFIPQFSVQAPDSHGPDAPPIMGVPILVRGHDGRIGGRYHAGNVQGLTDETRLALETFRATVSATAEINWVGQRGDLLFYSNTSMLHRRQSYEPRYDGHDRMYIRCYFDRSETIADISKGHDGGRVFK